MLYHKTNLHYFNTFVFISIQNLKTNKHNILCYFSKLEMYVKKKNLYDQNMRNRVKRLRIIASPPPSRVHHRPSTYVLMTVLAGVRSGPVVCRTSL